MTEDIPQWASDRAFALANKYGHVGVPCGAIDAFARYIAEHEQPPVDPLLIEAREIVARSDHDPWSAESPWHLNQANLVREGRSDNSLVVRAAYNGLKRGMELASDQFADAGKMIGEGQ